MNHVQRARISSENPKVHLVIIGDFINNGLTEMAQEYGKRGYRVTTISRESPNPSSGIDEGLGERDNGRYCIAGQSTEGIAQSLKDLKPDFVLYHKAMYQPQVAAIKNAMEQNRVISYEECAHPLGMVDESFGAINAHPFEAIDNHMRKELGIPSGLKVSGRSAA